jgi:microcystin-dependent protein
MTESIGRQYETAVPSLSDTANIQEAFRIYHYGKPTTEFNPTNTEPSDLEPKSIAYYLNNFQDQINDITSILSPTAYEKRGNLVVAGDDGPIVLELNPEYPATFSENGLVLTSDDGEDSGMSWQAPSITSTNIANLSNKKFINSTVWSDGLGFDDSTSQHTTTLKSPSQASSKTVFFPTSAAVMPGSSTTLVGTDTTQTLTNKTLTSAVVTSGGDVVGTTATQTLTNKTISLEAADNTITGRLPSTNGGIPAGVISQFAGSSAPAGYLLCQGQSVSTTTFAGLFAAIGYTYGGSGSSFVIPNFQGRVPVGVGTAPSGNGVLAKTLAGSGGDETVVLTVPQMPSHTHIQDSHNHTQDSHSHGASSGDAGSHGHTASTNTAGAHTHAGSVSHNHNSFNGTAVRKADSTTATTVQSTSVSSTSQSVTTQGTHINVSAGGHTHTVTVDAGGSHSHTVSVNNATATNQATTATNQNTGGGGAHNNLQPYIVVNYIIKT